MSTRRFFNLAVWLLGFVLVAGLGTAVSQQAAPTETKGVTIAPLDAIDLGPEIPGAQGRQFRMRLVTFAPAGIFGLHSHKDPATRPGFFYVLSGTLISYMSGVPKEYRPGDFWAENIETTHHWVENKGTIPAVGIAVDIFKQQ
ncbi:MAG: cupin domain-containing protein [Candidatus Methylomirabilales bacterium]